MTDGSKLGEYNVVDLQLGLFVSDISERHARWEPVREHQREGEGPLTTWQRPASKLHERRVESDDFKLVDIASIASTFVLPDLSLKRILLIAFEADYQVISRERLIDRNLDDSRD